MPVGKSCGNRLETEGSSNTSTATVSKETNIKLEGALQHAYALKCTLNFIQLQNASYLLHFSRCTNILKFNRKLAI
jgi:hypothetical protein